MEKINFKKALREPWGLLQIVIMIPILILAYFMEIINETVLMGGDGK